MIKKSGVLLPFTPKDSSWVSTKDLLELAEYFAVSPQRIKKTLEFLLNIGICQGKISKNFYKYAKIYCHVVEFCGVETVLLTPDEDEWHISLSTKKFEQILDFISKN